MPIMDTLGFVNKHLQAFATAPGGVGKQCVDLVNLYLIERWGRPPVRLNAVDWRSASIDGYQWTANSPDNSPSIGDLVVWGPYAPLGVGPYGHIALCLLADSSHIVSFDQDWPFGAPCSLQLHGYGGVLGWQRLL